MFDSSKTKTPADNERFGASGAVTPQTILYKFARYYPAGTVVEAPPASSRWDVICHFGTVRRVETGRN